MKGEIWLLYDAADYAVNRDFAQLMRERGVERGMDIRPVTTGEIDLCMDGSGEPYCLLGGEYRRPVAMLSRQRDALVSRHFEHMGVPVFNNSLVCAICNDKRVTHQFLRGLPMPHSIFVQSNAAEPSPCTQFPVLLKPACSHGGDRVCVVNDEVQWRSAVAAIGGDGVLQQRVVDGAGRDLRVYVVHGEIIAGVMRTARTGVVSNFKKGGDVALHLLSVEEHKLAQAVIDRFAKAGAPLSMAGVDLLYDQDGPVVGEVEDVVGSRMLYRTSDIDIVALFLDGLKAKLQFVE